MKNSKMISVQDALACILEHARALHLERVALDDLTGRVAAWDHHAEMSQPPFAASAMDGYAVRYQDAQQDSELSIIGEVKAGAAADLKLGVGQAIRIFTGAPIPSGADHVIIQEDVVRTKNIITVTEPQSGPRNIRKAGVDFAKGAVLAKEGQVLNEFHGSLFAAANVTYGCCRRKPKVAFFSAGDELRSPGADLKPGQIINSTQYVLSALIRSWGGIPVYLGCAPDDPEIIMRLFEEATFANLILSVGGASVGDYDFVKKAFGAAGGGCVFDKVAVRPGKPTWFGFLGLTRVIGLPGNPASAIVAAALFAKPLIQKMAGLETSTSEILEAVTDSPLPANGARETYLRARLSKSEGQLSVTPYPNQDSSLLSPFASCNALIRREIRAPEVESGERVEILQILKLNG